MDVEFFLYDGYDEGDHVNDANLTISIISGDLEVNTNLSETQMIALYRELHRWMNEDTTEVSNA